MSTDIIINLDMTNYNLFMSVYESSHNLMANYILKKMLRPLTMSPK